MCILAFLNKSINIHNLYITKNKDKKLSVFTARVVLLFFLASIMLDITILLTNNSRYISFP